MPHIILTGFKSCGKTTIGRLVARSLGRPFEDLDHVIEEIYAEDHEPLGFREIYRRVGADGFRALELQAAHRLRRRAEATGHQYVLSLGGGSLMDEEVRAALHELGLIVYLQVPFPEILRRVKRQGFPAYIRGDDPESELAGMFQDRDPIYREASDRVVLLHPTNPAKAAECVIEMIREDL